MLPIIYLAFANDANNPLHQLSAEERAIREILRERYVQKGHFLVESNAYTRVEDLRKDFTQFRDQIFLFHYSGHASGESLLLPTGNAKAKGLGGMLGELPNLKLVILNGCETQDQVDHLLELGLPAVVATHTKIEDNLARQFSEQFYESLVQGLSIEEAYNQWVNYLDTLGENAKALINPRDLDEDEEDFIQDTNKWGLFYRKDNPESLQARLPQVSYLEKNRKRIFALVGVLTIALLALAGISFYNYVQPFDYVFEVIDKAGNPTRALTGELDKLIADPGDSLMFEEKETPEFILTQTDPPIKGRISEEGNIYFENLPYSLRNEPLGYQLISRFYQVAGTPPSIEMSGSRSKLQIERTEALCCIKGMVLVRPDHRPLEGALVQFQDTVYKTNLAGIFTIRVPETQQKRQQSIRISHPDIVPVTHTLSPELINLTQEPALCAVDPK